jgi:hypothetical protein
MIDKKYTIYIFHSVAAAAQTQFTLHKKSPSTHLAAALIQGVALEVFRLVEVVVSVAALARFTLH